MLALETRSSSNGQGSTCVNIPTDTKCSLAACTQASVEQHKLPIKKSDQVYNIENVLDYIILSNKFVNFRIQLRKKSGHQNVSVLNIPNGRLRLQREWNGIAVFQNERI
jgi:hypothetical protein